MLIPISFRSDDEEELQRVIQPMDMIYEGSTLNIIAASGYERVGRTSKKPRQEFELVLQRALYTVDAVLYQGLGVRS